MKCEVCEADKTVGWIKQKNICGRCMLIMKTLDEACITIAKKLIVYEMEGFNGNGKKQNKMNVVKALSRTDLDETKVAEMADKITFDDNIIKRINNLLKEKNEYKRKSSGISE